MRNTITLLTIVAVISLFALPVLAGDAGGTLYQQEGTTADGYAAINADGQGPVGDSANWTNWKWQYGSGTWSGVYMDSGWLEESSSGDPNLDIEADIEMYYSESYANNKIYFHLGNIYTATQADKTAYVDGTFTCNNGQYLGISFDGTSKDESDMLKDGGGNYTGEVQDAMVGTKDVLGRNISSENFNVKLLLSWDSGTTYNTPISYGDGASGTIQDTLWWLINGGQKGSYNLKWSVELLPETHQADGNYKFDPALVAAPIL
jgi:hypothetical protein